jgi:muramidase (phage lysozyme)
VSDYFSPDPVGSNAYQVTGIYRKVYDEKAKKRQDAFLQMLRILETRDDWYILNAPIDNKKHFSDTSKHPWSGKDKPSKGTTAAGAYQFTIDTYEEFRKKDYYSGGQSFDPGAQEHLAIRLLERQGQPKSSALSLIRQGKIREAIDNTRLFVRWSCLPGGVEPQVKSMDEFISRWQQLL